MARSPLFGMTLAAVIFAFLNVSFLHNRIERTGGSTTTTSSSIATKPSGTGAVTVSRARGRGIGEDILKMASQKHSESGSWEKIVKDHLNTPDTRDLHRPYPAREGVFHQDTCPKDVRFNDFLLQRQWEWKGRKDAKFKWQFIVNYKIMGNIYARKMGISTPRIYFCTRGANGLDEFEPTEEMVASGFVVKRLKGYSAKGVYVFKDGFDSFEAFSGIVMSKQNVIDSIQTLGHGLGENDPIYVEEFMNGEIEGQVPYDFKFYMFGGTIGSIAVIANRGTPRACHRWYDENWFPTDIHGCYRNREDQKVEDLPFCSRMEPPPSFEEMKEKAKKLGEGLGIFYRIDLFRAKNGEIILGEFTPWPANGKFHCSGNFMEKNQIDIDYNHNQFDQVDLKDWNENFSACRLGELWRKGGVDGGPGNAMPDWLKDSVYKSLMTGNEDDYDFTTFCNAAIDYR